MRARQAVADAHVSSPTRVGSMSLHTASVQTQEKAVPKEGESAPVRASTSMPIEVNTATFHGIRPHAQQLTFTEGCSVFGQEWVRKGMANFNSKMASPCCFCALHMLRGISRLTAPSATECVHCSHDSKKHFSSQ